MVNINQAQLTQNWWLQIKGNIDSFSNFINEPLQDLPIIEHFSLIEHLKSSYRQIQYFTCAEIHDDLYTFITQAILNLWLAYDEYRCGEASIANQYLTTARTKAIELQNMLMRYGIVEVFGVRY
jgi:hypothetical protein